MNKSIYTIRLLLLLLAFTAQQSFAQTTSWKGTTSTAWATSSNWTNGVPDSSKDAIIGDANFTGSFSPFISTTARCKSLVVGGTNAATLTVSRTFKAFENVTIQSNGTIDHGNAIIYLVGNFTNNGAYAPQEVNSKINFIGNVQTVGGTTVTNFKKIYIAANATMVLANDITAIGAGCGISVFGEINPGVAPGYMLSTTARVIVFNGGKLKVNKANFSDNYELAAGLSLGNGSIVDYASTEVNQNISNTYSYSTLMISGTGVKSLTSNLPAFYSRSTTGGKIVVSSGTFDMQTYSANRGSVIPGGEIAIADGATLKLSGSSNFPRNFASSNMTASSNVHYYGTTQDIAEQSYGNLMVSGVGTKNVTTNITVKGDLNLMSGDFNCATNPIVVDVKGSVLMTDGTLTGTNEVFKMSGTSDQIINVNGGIPNLTVDKNAGALYLGADLSITDNLIFSGGIIRTDNNVLSIGENARITGAGQVSGWVLGNLKRVVETGTSISKSFPIGTETYYTPATIAFDQVTTGGDVIATTTAIDHPELYYSGMNPNKSVNHYWTLSNQGVVFTTSDITFNWNAANLDGGADFTTLRAGKYENDAWILETITSRSATSIKSVGVTALGDFAVGEIVDEFHWTGGAFSNDWFTPKNWFGGIPSETSVVTIPNPIGGRRIYPNLTAGQTGQVKDLVIENDAELIVSGGTLEIFGNATSAGMLDAQNGTVKFSGASPQTIASGLFFDNKVKNLEINNNVTLADVDTLTGLLMVSAGKTFATNDNLILKSDANGTASVAALPVDGAGNATAFIEGNVSIERFIPARKAWRLLSAPIKAATSQNICGAWQEGATGSSFAANSNPNPGYGVHITGGTVGNGFDQSVTNLPSIKYYNNTLNGFVGLPSTPGTITPITSYDGYMIYIRGDRSINLMQGNNAAITATTLRVRGEVKTGNQTTAVNAQRFTVLGNPFPSAIDFATLTKNNVKNSFYIWDPKLAGSSGLGAYVTVSYNEGTGSYDVTTAASPISHYIPSGEAVLIESADGATPGSITVKESDKAIGVDDGLFGRNHTTTQAIRANLYAIENNGTYSLLDGALTTYHENNSNGIDRNDVTKMNGSAENISFSRNLRNLAIERRSTIKNNDTSFISLTQIKKQAYRLTIVAEDMNVDGLIATVTDNYTGATSNVPVDLKGTTHVDFTVNNDAASYATNRFYIVFTYKTNTPTAEVEKATVINEVKAAIVEKSSAVVYPNPVVSNNIQVKLNNVNPGMYQFKLYNITGQLVATQMVNYTTKESVVTMKVVGLFIPGKYELKIDGEGKTMNTSVLKQ